VPVGHSGHPRRDGAVDVRRRDAGLFIKRRWPAVAERSLTPVASGLIAGESVTGIVVALARALGAPLS
jgi:uncharacterized oligopeptide transporter (OPT) family protein